MYIPTAAHIYAKYSTQESGTNWLKILESQIAAENNVEKAFILLSQEIDMILINLTPAFNSAAKDGAMLFYPFDTHWNSEGREVAATFVAETLDMLEQQGRGEHSTTGKLACTTCQK